MRRNNYKQNLRDAIQGARDARGTGGYQVIVALLEAKIEELKDSFSRVSDDELPAIKHSINVLKGIAGEIERDVRDKTESAKTGAYTE